MQLSDIVSFMNPIGDGLSTFFALLLITLSIGTVLWLIASAKAENWEINWNGEEWEGGASLDSEHGSVHELAETVATKAEKVADIMPGMLLIIGLLGTFVGLGIALNSASDVLAAANTSGMDNAMANLMKLMEGLGAKFKTSTYGLLCFISLNILFNVFGFKEKRLAWAISKVKEESDAKKAELERIENEKYKNLLGLMSKIGKQIQNDNQSLLQFFESSQTKTENYQNNFLNKFIEINQAHQQLLDTHSQTQIKELRANLMAVQALERQSQQNNTELINNLVNQNNQVIQTLNQGFDNHITQIQNNGKNTINELTTIANSLTNGFKDNLTQAQEYANNSLNELKNIADYNKQTQNAMQEFVDKTVASMSSIGESADKMGESAKAVGESANDLNAVVQTLKSELTSVMSDIKTDLGDVMGTIKTDLGDTITTMGDNFKENISNMSHSIQSNMEQMSSSMSNATKGIESAVESLSDNVGNTMSDVTQKIGKSMDLQEKSAREFTVTSESLNTQIMEMTNLVQQLSGDITSSLDSVAQNGRRMEKIGKSLADFEGFFAILSETNPKMLEQLEKIANNNQGNSYALTQIKES